MKTLSPLIKRLYWSQGTSVVRPSSVAYDVNAQIKVRMSKERKFMLFCCSEQSKKRTFDHFEDEIWIRINLSLLYEDPLPRMSCLHGHGFSANGDMVIDRIDQFRGWIHFPSKGTCFFHAWRRDRSHHCHGKSEGNEGTRKRGKVQT